MKLKATFYKRKKVEKIVHESTDEIFSHAMIVLKEPSSYQLDIFGQNVTMEQRGIQPEQIRQRAKREINIALLKGQDDDQGQNLCSHYLYCGQWRRQKVFEGGA